MTLEGIPVDLTCFTNHRPKGRLIWTISSQSSKPDFVGPTILPYLEKKPNRSTSDNSKPKIDLKQEVFFFGETRNVAAKSKTEVARKIRDLNGQ